VLRHYPIRPEREAHVIVGGSMGGSAAYRIAIEHRDLFAIVAGFFPAVNLRWVDCHEHYRGKFDPCCWGWRERLRPHEIVGVFYGGLLPVTYGELIRPLFGVGPDAIPEVSRINPIEAMERTDLQPGELQMYMAYGGKDEFNIEAQAQSFLYLARQRGLCVRVDYDPKGRHGLPLAREFFQSAAEWLAPLIAPYAPPLTSPCPAH
jgi:S-formylglutathione hydrolase FrmB